MKLSKILQVTQKVVPFKTIAPIFIIMGVISLYLIIMTIHSDNKPNKYFYETLIIGKIDDIRHKEQYIWYKIGQDWFILLNNQTRDLSIGDIFLFGTSLSKAIISRNHLGHLRQQAV